MAKTVLDKAWAMMTADGFPRELHRTAEQRKAWWEANPPRATQIMETKRFRELAPETQALLQELEEKKKIKTANRITKLKARQGQPIDTAGLRWNPRHARWEPDYPQQLNPQETDMGKIKVDAYDKNNKKLPRASSSVKTIEEVEAKVEYCFQRGGKAVVMVSVTGAEGEKVSAWARDPETKAISRNDELYMAPVQVTFTPELGPDNRMGQRQRSPRKVAAGENSEQPATNDGSEEGDTMSNRKQSKTARAEKDPGTGRGPGVISTIVDTISRASGATIEEIVAILAKRFPERKVKSMTTTAKIQANRYATHKEKNDKRGLIYYKVIRG